MQEKTDRANEILDVAERMARNGGYGGFSFRDIANEVGVKSASVHYHFPTKDALAAALSHRYTDRFFEALGDPEDVQSADGAEALYIGGFRRALIDDGLMCLCGMLGAEIDALPANVGGEVKRFFETSLTWLETALKANGVDDAGERRRRAVGLIASVEGAMIVARTLGDPSFFDEALADRLGATN